MDRRLQNGDLSYSESALYEFKKYFNVDLSSSEFSCCTDLILEMSNKTYTIIKKFNDSTEERKEIFLLEYKK